MHKVVRIDIEKSDEILREIKEFARKLKDMGAKEVYLFGSFARGDFKESSDIDLLIIWDLDMKPLERIVYVMSLTDLPVEPIVLTTEEFEKAKNLSFYKSILKYAKRL